MQKKTRNIHKNKSCDLSEWVRKMAQLLYIQKPRNPSTHKITQPLNLKSRNLSTKKIMQSLHKKIRQARHKKSMQPLHKNHATTKKKQATSKKTTQPLNNKNHATSKKSQGTSPHEKVTQPHEWVIEKKQPFHPKTSLNLSSQKLTQPFHTTNHAALQHKKSRILKKNHATSPQKNPATSTKKSGALSTKKIRHPCKWVRKLRNLSKKNCANSQQKKSRNPSTKNWKPSQKLSWKFSTSKILQPRLI